MLKTDWKEQKGVNSAKSGTGVSPPSPPKCSSVPIISVVERVLELTSKVYKNY